MFHIVENEVDESTKNTAVSRFLQHHAFNEACHILIAQAFHEESQFESMARYYRVGFRDCAGSKDEYTQWKYYFVIDRLTSALFKFSKGPNEREEAIVLWENGLKDGKVNQTRYVTQLCKAYIKQAREAGLGSQTANVMIAKVTSFLTNSSGEARDTDMSQAEVRALLARYYRVVGDLPKAQELVRPDIELALTLLSDDIENDWQGYLKVADALKGSGASEEAQVA